MSLPTVQRTDRQCAPGDDALRVLLACKILSSAGQKTAVCFSSVSGELLRVAPPCFPVEKPRNIVPLRIHAMVGTAANYVYRGQAIHCECVDNLATAPDHRLHSNRGWGRGAIRHRERVLRGGSAR